MRANVTCLIDAGEPIDAALRRFKKACDKGLVFGEMRRHEHHVSRGERRRLKSKVARKRERTRAAKRAAAETAYEGR